MRLDIWIVFLLATTLASLTPGPAVLAVVATALRAGAGAAWSFVAGIMTANLVYFGLAAIGLQVLLASDSLFQAVRWVGAGYLVWMGARALFGRAHTVDIAAATSPALPGWTLFRQAVLLQATNPKAYIYLAALLPQFIDPARPFGQQMAVIVPTATVAEILVLGGYAHAAGGLRHLTLGSRFVGLADRAAGAILIVAGFLVLGFVRK